MATVLKYGVALEAGGREGMLASVASLLRLEADFPELCEKVRPRIAPLIDNGTDLIRIEDVDSFAIGAGMLQVKLVPGEQYLELIAAYTADGFVHVSELCHGWPILSSVSKTTMAEGAALSRRGPGSEAA